jgi:flagellar protein FlbD
MIMLTRLNGLPFALNPDLVERAESTPDTILTLCDGTKIVIGETVEELVDRIRTYRAQVLALADTIQTSALAPATAPALHVVHPMREA